MTASQAEELHLTFPRLLDSVETVSKSAQSQFFLFKGMELGGLALAAAVSATPEEWWGGYDSVIALLLFAFVGILQVSGSSANAEARWYEARAAAESIKSLSWHYAVRGAVFPDGGADASREFVDRLREILGRLKHLDQAAGTTTDAAVTASMTAVRASDLSTRIATYKRDRVEDQLGWYETNATKNRVKRCRYLWGAVGIEAVAIVFACLHIKHDFEVDLLAVFAAVGASLVGWTQAKKFNFLVESYALTSQEIALLTADIGSAVAESEWAERVHESETAFSREHTMWLARTRDR